MGLQEEMERLKADIAKAQEAEEQAEVVAEEEVASEESPAEEVTEETTEEAPAEPEKKPDEEKPAAQAATEDEAPPSDNAGWQKLRREKAAALKKAAELEAKLAERAMATTAEDIAEETIAPVNSPEVEEVLQEHRMNRAEREFKSLEANFKAKVPEYDNVSTEYVMGLAQSIRIQNPRWTPMQVAEETKKTILIKAANYMKEGFDPIEELYHEARELGFTGKSLQKQEAPVTEVKEELKPDLKKVAQNRARSTNMTATAGRSEGTVTKQAAADMTVAEWSKLPKSEKQRLMYG